ncbi:MAG: radical SAM protein [Chloroflexota bacterium]|nr:radical SAM protein [Chloroflexota bacterium]
MIYSKVMARVHYTEITCKSALNAVHGMPFKWSLNPYRGCTHSCHYCYARATHTYHGLNAGTDFETKILVKTNLPDVLRRELARPTWLGERVAIGTATDPYQPCEGRYRLTRRALEALRDRRNPLSIVTKSTLILRDLDLLSELADLADVTVFFTVTTLDPAIWRKVEPGTPPPLQRLRVMQRLVEAGVPCGVFLAPILPGITDSRESIEAVAKAAKEHGATTFGTSVLRLAPFVKEHYFGFVAATYPDLLPRYERAYQGTNASADYLVALERRIAHIRSRHGFGPDTMRRPDPPAHAPVSAMSAPPCGQLALPL